MCRDSLEDAGEGSGFDWLMSGNDLVVLSVALRGHANVRSFLAGDLIAQDAQRPCQLRSVDVARQSHQASTSSRTKWRRMIDGGCIVSSK